VVPFFKIEPDAPKPLSPPGYPKTLNTSGDHIRRKRLDSGLLQKDVAKVIRTIGFTICNRETNYVKSNKYQIIEYF